MNSARRPSAEASPASSRCSRVVSSLAPNRYRYRSRIVEEAKTRLTSINTPPTATVAILKRAEPTHMVTARTNSRPRNPPRDPVLTKVSNISAPPP